VLLVISPFKILSVINLIIVYTVYKTPLGVTRNQSVEDLVGDKLDLNGLVTSNTSGCLINSIDYYQVYHRQDLERTDYE
jgi:hypothetical protein